MTTLTEFLEARLSEAQRDAETRNTAAFIHETGCYYYNNQYDPAHCDCAGPEHALREVTAKRALLLDFTDELRDAERHQDIDMIEAYTRLLGVLAAPYSDHPDFDSNWSTT